MRILEPSGVKGVQEWVEKWGQIIWKLHEEQDMLLSSVLYTCENIEKYNKAVHIFLQFLYIEEILTKEGIKGWFGVNEGKMRAEMMNICRPFLAKLEE